ncbi:hypothetical protein MKZ38_005915 [Zalerion maritima]|uniref:Uncharacterized protein n=1 Tax=Zalerion maritima TaxID=339359 RepID=A0AAD5WNQ7_9PEZI|nr:hypothetical protein MKZ38_005915 [Zalerion maritima]
MSAGDQIGLGPQFVMPGTFHLDGGSGHGSAPPTLTGVHPGLFRPPTTPSASSSMHLTKSTASVRSEGTTQITNVKRKRSRPSISRRTRQSTPLNDWTLAGEKNFSSSTAAASQITALPVHTPSHAFSNSSMSHCRQDVDHEFPAARHYMLAGQLDTPNGGVSRHMDNPNGILDESTYSDADYRRELGSKRHCDEMEGGSMPPLTLTQNSNEPPPNSQNSDGWSRFAFHTISGVVGKVWEFCKAGAFRGFYAGGGLGYNAGGNIDSYHPPLEFGSRDNPHDSIYKDFDSPMGCGVTDHALLPASDYNPYTYEGQTTPESTPPPAAKRRQVSDNRDAELRRNWVLVTEPSSKPSSQGAKNRPPTKKRFGAHQGPSAQSFSPRPQSRASATPSRPSIGPRYGAPTTSSSGRRISVPVSRLSHNEFPSSASTVGGDSYTPHRRSNSRASAAGGLMVQTREPASFASSRPPNSSPTTRNYAGRASTPSRRESCHPRPRTPSRIPVLSPNRFAASQGGGQDARMTSPSASRGHGRSQSTASTGNTRGTKKSGVVAEQSPRLTDEARHLATKRLAVEREVDARMNAFNRSLQDMIRQGKEALGTKVEVEFDGDHHHEDVGPGGWIDE